MLLLKRGTQIPGECPKERTVLPKLAPCGSHRRKGLKTNTDHQELSHESPQEMTRPENGLR